MRKKLELKSIERERADCRAAFRKTGRRCLTIHCHHETLFECLIGSAKARIEYICLMKPEQEKALRLRLFRPVRAELLPKPARKLLAAYKEAPVGQQGVRARIALLEDLRGRADARLHARLCVKGCPWNGSTIFQGSSN